MTALASWGLAVVALVLGYVSYGWPGVALALTVVVFWLLLQFSRALRTLRAAAGRPVGTVKSAVMLQAKLHPGMRLMHIIKLTQSLGTPVRPEPETFRWQDDGGDAVVAEMHDGKLAHWRLERAAAPGAETPAS